MPDRKKVMQGLRDIKTYLQCQAIKASANKNDLAREGFIESQKDIDDALELLKEQEAKRGKWIPVTNGRGGMECSICHDYAPNFSNGSERLSLYCPNCGAKMNAVKLNV